MSIGRSLLLGVGVCLGSLLAQDCPAVGSVPPNGTLAGALDAASCQLADRTPYAPYRLDLPARGQIKLDVSGDFTIILRDTAGSRIDAGASLLRPIEAGSYTLLVNGRAAGQTGNYTLTASFTSEPGILCSNFPNIGRRQTVTGNLPGAGCIAFDGTPYEAYTLTSDSDGTLTVEVKSQGFTPVIAVRSIDGYALAAPSASPANVVLAADSQYLVVISSTDANTGAYQIVTTFQPAGDETCRPARALADSDSDARTITTGGCFVTIAGTGDQSYYNYYDIALPAAGLVAANAASGDFTPTLKLLDAAGNLLASDTGGGSDASSVLRSTLRAQLPAGSYRLQILSDLASGGAYSLQYTLQTANPQPCMPAAWDPGVDLPGALSATSCRTSLGPSDLYTLTLPSAGTLDLKMTSAVFATRLALRDGQDNLIVADDEDNGLTGTHVAADLPAGTYTLVSAASTGAGNYVLSGKYTPHDVPACTFAQALDLNGGYIQRLGARSCTGANGQPVDYYSFTLPVDALVLAVMTSSELDGYLTLYDATGNVLRSDDNGYGYNDPLIVQYLPAGSYKLAARAASSTAGGLYEVDLRTVTGSRPPLCTPKGTVTPGSSVTGTLTYTACQYLDNTFADFYQMTLAADTAIDLQVNSADFDTYLVVFDSKGAVVDEDDDSGGGTNARITRNLAAGTYYVAAKAFGDYTDNGTYTLVAKTGN